MISIVDETLVDLEKDDRDKDSIFQRVERRWLGFVEIPFPTVYYSVKVCQSHDNALYISFLIFYF